MTDFWEETDGVGRTDLAPVEIALLYGLQPRNGRNHFLWWNSSHMLVQRMRRGGPGDRTLTCSICRRSFLGVEAFDYRSVHLRAHLDRMGAGRKNALKVMFAMQVSLHPDVDRRTIAAQVVRNFFSPAELASLRKPLP